MLVLAAGALVALPKAHATDVFGVPENAIPQQHPAPTRALPLPDGMRRAIGKVLLFQGEMNDALQSRVADLRHLGMPSPAGPITPAGSGTPRGWLTLIELIGLCIAYGVLHALAPGHGKFVVASQFATRRASGQEIASLSARIALGQSLTAIALVGAVVLFSRLAQGAAGDLVDGAMTGAGPLELISNAALVFVGLAATWRIVTGRECCTLDEPFKLARAPRGESPDESPRGTYLGMTLTRAQRSDGRAFALASAAPPYRGVRGLGLATALRPCAGALFVLLVASTAHVFWAGVLAALSIGLGVALTLGLIGTGVTSTMAFMLMRPRLRQGFERAQHGVALGGALSITVFGLLQIALLMSGTIALGPG